MPEPLHFPHSTLPDFAHLNAAKEIAEIKQQITANQAALQQLLSTQTMYSWENLMENIENMNDILQNKWSPISHLHAVLANDLWRNTYNELLPQLTAFYTELSQNEALFHAILSLRDSEAAKQFNAAQHKIIQNDIRDFKLAGVDLPKEKKARLAELEQQLSQLSTTFSEHILDATESWTLHIIDDKEVAQFPAEALQFAIDNAKKRGLNGYVITLDFPSYSTAMRFLANRDLRRELYTAYATRASDQGPHAYKWDNTPVMNNILNIRHEIAKLVGFANFATYSLATKMAKTPEEVLSFLEDLLAKSISIAQSEYQELMQLALTDGITDLATWDVPYYSEKLQQLKFQFTQEDLRPYFPIEKVLTGFFTILKRLFGIHLIEEKNISVWHKDVQFFAIYDEKQQLRGGLYMDLYARDQKRDGAWMDACRNRRASLNQVQYPVAYLTCNFMPKVGDKPALLTHDELLTLFHEMGHCLQHLLTTIDYPAVGGISGIPWDAVEFPSQFLENFCWEKEVLQLISGHYQTGDTLPEHLYQSLLASKHFQTGLQMIRQLEFSLFDFHLHLEYDATNPNYIQNCLDHIRQKTAVIPVPSFNRFQHSFSHIFGGGYAAGYYSYKWAEVLSADAYSKFEEEGIFNHATGMSFMQHVLEPGGVPDPIDTFIAFRGRKPDITPLLKQNGILSTEDSL